MGPPDYVARVGGRNVTVEVRSSAKVQSWKQKKHSALQFGIAPSRKWNPERRKILEALKSGFLSACYGVTVQGTTDAKLAGDLSGDPLGCAAMRRTGCSFRLSTRDSMLKIVESER